MPAGTRLTTLKIRADFLRIAASRQKAVTPGVIVQAAPRPAGLKEDGVRVGFTASRRVGSAVVRNCAKRRLRAAAAQILASEGRPGTDYVLIARSTTAERPFAALLGDLAIAVRRVDRGAVRHRSPTALKE